VVSQYPPAGTPMHEVMVCSLEFDGHRPEPDTAGTSENDDTAES